MPDTRPTFIAARSRALSLRCREAAAIAERIGLGNPERLRELGAMHAVALRAQAARG
ncbi:MAG: hypothetical protein KDC33_03500 [Thermoleophilia bacterium]|mgnify:CR=1 FL=1|nr:hypothetical protein [Thermoleophilia bacterium]